MQYDELITKLRCCSESISCRDCEYTYHCGGEKMNITEAAYAIEELNKQLEQYHKYDSFLYVHGCFKEEADV